MRLDLAAYRRWISDTGVVRARLRSVEEPSRIVPRRADHQDERQSPQGRRADDGYTLATPPVTQSPEKDWPKFPGEGLTYVGGPPSGDPVDDDQHMGGPR